MQFPGPAYVTFVIPTGATSGQRIVFNESGSGTIRVYDSSNTLVAEIGGNDGRILSILASANSFAELLNGAVYLGGLSGGAPDLTNSATLSSTVDSGAGTALTSLFSAKTATKTQSAIQRWYPGTAASGVGSANAPVAEFGIGDGSTAMTVKVGGTVVAADLNGSNYTWQTPTYLTGWAAATLFTGVSPVEPLRYRKTAEDETWLYGAFTTDATGTANVFTMTSGYYDTTVQSGFPVMEKQAAGPFQVGFGYISTAGNFHIDLGANFTRNAGDRYYVNAKIPIGNLA